MSNPNSPEARKLAKELSDLRKLQKASHIAPRLPYSSVPEGNLVVTDSEGNVVDVVGPNGNPESGDQLILPGREPSKPSVPILTAYLGTITATWDGSYVEEYVAPDLLQIEVHSSTDDDFESSAGTLVGTITGQHGGSVTVAVEYGTHYVRFVAVSTSGSRSVESDIASVEVTPLVETIEMSEVLDDIDQRFGGVITEAQQLNDKLAEARTDIDSSKESLDNLENVKLPQVEANIEAAHQEIVTTGAELGSRLDQAETDLDTAEAGLNTLKNTDLPALKQRLTDAETEITTTGQQLDARLDDAFIQIGTVDDKTAANATAASNAQTAADSANTAAANAAGIAGSKGKVLVQSTAPAVADRNAVTLWIDTTGGANTPKRWTSGTTWVAVTDKAATDAAQAAVTAQARADSAHTAAGNAQTTANNALTMAGSKNSVFYSANAPSGTASLGDTWRRVNTKGDVIGEWRWTAGNTWLAQQVTTEMISNLDVGKLTAGTANISDLVVEKLWAEVIRAKKITTDQLLVGSGSNLIVDPFFEDATTKAARATLSSNMSGGYGRNAATNLNWFGGTQTAGTVQTYYFSTINSRTKTDSMIPIVEGSKYRFKFLYNSVSGGARPVASVVRKDGTTAVTASGFKINGVLSSSYGSAGSGQIMEAVWEPAPSWDYAYFVPGIQWESTVTSAHIYGGASVQNMTDGSLIVDGSIDADSINTNSIVAEVAKFIELDVSSLIASNATINTAVIEKLWTDVIRSRKITTDQLLVGQGENLIPWDVNSTLPDRTANFLGYGGGSTNPGIQANAGVADGKHLFMVADWVTSGTGTNTWRIMSDPSASPWGLQGFKVEPEEEFQAQIYVRAGGSYTSGMPSVALAGVWYKADGTYIVTNIGTASSLTWSWDKREVSLKAPATAAYLHLYVRQDQPGGIRVDLPSLYRKKGASLIVENGIQAKHIEASESMSAKVGQFLKLDVKDLVSTGTAKMNQAVIDKLWTDVVHSKKITSDMVVIGGTNNLIPNANVLTDLAGWEPSTANVLRTTGSNGPDATTPYMYVTNRGNIRSTDFEVSGGNKFRFKVKAQAAATGSRIYVQLNNNGTGNPYIIENKALTTSWVTYSGEVELPEDATKASINIYVNHTNGGVTTQRFAYMSLIQMASGELIVDGAITAGKIKTNAVESDKIKANAITADKIDVGAIKAEHISAREITADKLRIGQGSNVFPDPLMKDAVGWNAASTLTAYTGGYGSSNRVRVTAGTGQTGGYYGNGADDVRRFPVVPGRSYVVSVWVRPTVNISVDSVIGVYTRLVQETGAGFVWPSPSLVTNNFRTTGYGLNPSTGTRTGAIPASTWVKMEGIVSIPADTTYTYIIPGLYLQAGFPTGSSCDFSNLNISEAVTGELIVEGSITTDKLKAGAITADKLDADAITGKTITGGSISGATLSLSRNRYEVNVGYDADGAYLGFQTPRASGVRGTIRAHETNSDDPAQLVIKAPMNLSESERSFLSVTSESNRTRRSGSSYGRAALITNSDLVFTRDTEVQSSGYLSMTSISHLAGVDPTDLKLYSDTSQGGYVQSKTTYARTYSTSAAMCITGSGVFGRTISALKYKQDVETVNPEDYEDLLLSIDHKSWIDKAEAKRYSDYVEWEKEHPNQPIPEEMMEYPTKEPSRHYGAIADDFHNAGLGQYVHYDTNGQVDGLAYERIGVALIPIVREQRDKIADLESRLATLEALVLPKEQ